jgi:hypothetical protein
MYDFSDRFFYVLWQFNCEKPLPRIEIVLPRFIDYTNEFMRLCIRIFEKFVNFPKLQRTLVLIILDTHNEAFRFAHCRRSTRFTFINRLPMPCASYQCTSASAIVPFAKRTTVKPFNFRQLPAPKSLVSMCRSRIPRPDAMTSTPRISPMTSNFTGAKVPFRSVLA